MHRIASLAVLLCIFALAACAPPRGAALSSEVLKAQDEENPYFQVVPVTPLNVNQLERWPTTGETLSFNWIAMRPGPNSPVIRSGDHINLVIWDSQENSLLASKSEKAVNMPDLVVSPAGSIFVPYLDEVVINGQTPDQARSQIQNALAPIVPSAQVQLVVSAGRGNSVDLVSGVPKPGSYPLPDRNYSILSLIAQGGGINPSLRNPAVRLMREGKRYEIPAAQLLSDPSKNIILQGGDQVLVEEDKRYFTALGATGVQQLIYFEKESITALETMSMMGGLNSGRADPKGVLILRNYPARAVRNDGGGPNRQQVVFTFDLTSAEGLFAARAFEVNANDTVLVTEAPLVLTRSALSLIGATFGVANTVSIATGL